MHNDLAGLTLKAINEHPKLTGRQIGRWILNCKTFNVHTLSPHQAIHRAGGDWCGKGEDTTVNMMKGVTNMGREKGKGIL